MRGNRPESSKFRFNNSRNQNKQIAVSVEEGEEVFDSPNLRRPMTGKPLKKGVLGRSLIMKGKYSKVLPKNIQQDKERLYSQTIELKEANHKLASDLTKLKTRMSVLERENIRLKRLEDPGAMSSLSSTAASSLRVMLREAHDENEDLRLQIQKLKKQIKYTNLKQGQAREQQLAKEAMRLRLLLEQQVNRNISSLLSNERFQELQKELSRKIADNSSLEQEVAKLQCALRFMEDQLRTQAQKVTELDSKYSSKASALKKRLTEKESEIQSFKQNVRVLTEENSRMRIARVRNKNQPKCQSHEAEIKFLQERIHKLEEQLAGAQVASLPEINLAGSKKVQERSQQAEPEDQQYQPYYQDEQEVAGTTNWAKMGETSQMQDLRELLVYRLKFQTPLKELLAFIEQSLSPVLTIQQVSEVLVEKPLLVGDEQQVKRLLQYLFQSQKLSEQMTLENQTLVTRLKTFIGEVQQEEEEVIQQRYNDLIKKVRANLARIEAQLRKVEHQKDVVSKGALLTVMRKTGISNQLSEVMLMELSLYSQSMGHLRYRQFLENVRNQSGD